MNKSIIKKTINYYDLCLKKFGNNYKGMNWSSKKSQYLRFEQLIKIKNIKNKSVHDVGCGNGEFLKFLKKKKIKVSKFLGTDISQNMINYCNANYTKIKNVKFIKLNILDSKKLQNYDFVFASGIFNIKGLVPSKKWEDYVLKVIKQMYSRANIGLSFNFMTFDVDYKDKNIFYMSIDKLIKRLRNEVSKNIIINHSYPLWEFTVYIYKNN
jgi:SAM-dependent methyltransferase